jgi:hypothetical protein
MSLRLTQGDENRGERWFSTVPNIRRSLRAFKRVLEPDL